MKKLLAGLLGIVMMFSVAGCSEDKTSGDKNEEQAAEKIAEVNQAYAEFLISFMETDEWGDMYAPKFSTVYIDNDEVPELLIHEGTTRINGVRVYTYCNDDVVNINIDRDQHGGYGHYGDFHYKEKENVIVHWSYSTRGCGLSEWTIKDGKGIKINSFVNETFDLETDEQKVYGFTVNDEEVSEDEYISALNDRGYTYDPEIGPTTDGCDVATYNDAFEINEENIKTVFKAEGIVEETVKVEPINGTCGDNLTFELTEDGTLTISGTGEMYYYGGDELPPWNEQRKGIQKIIVEDGVETIGERAFAGTNVKEVNMPSSVYSIDHEAFIGCKKLTTVNFPEKIEGRYFFIGFSAFQNCISLKSVKLPERGEINPLIRIAEYAFSGCKSLTNVQLPEKFDEMTVSYGAFQYCTSLKTIKLPKNADVKNTAFKGCTDLTIYGEEGSYAQTYAEENGIAFVAE